MFFKPINFDSNIHYSSQMWSRNMRLRIFCIFGFLLEKLIEEREIDMPKISSIATLNLPYTLTQSETETFTQHLFQERIPNLQRLLKVFKNGEIETRNFVVPLEWHEKDHTFEERNNLYIEFAVQFGVEAIKKCLQNKEFLFEEIPTTEIDAIIFVSSTGISTPSIDARIMNKLPFSNRIRRIPLWGLGCAGGASGISRAFDYCLAYPTAKVLLLCIELSSLTFQRGDYSKSNLIGASLFADGVSAVLITGDEVEIPHKKSVPYILNTASKWLPNSLDIMGWDVQNDGLHVVFSKDIPSLILNWLKPFIDEFFQEQNISKKQLNQFIAHPGGKKVLDAYKEALGLTDEQLEISKNILKRFGNMSSPTVLYVLEQFMLKEQPSNDYGLLLALGPGFSGELVLLQWRD